MKSLLVALLSAAAFGPAAAASDFSTGGVAAATVAGIDRARVVLPGEAAFASYQNQGYRLEVDGNRAAIEVALTPLESQAALPKNGSAGEAVDASVARLARQLTVGESTVYGAASRILSWVGRNTIYDLDRSADQNSVAVLERGTGYCTGIARLTVSLLGAVGIEAREVAGFVFGLPSGGDGYHRWVEIHYPDRGWAFSDPMVSHHYVAATYVRLASPVLDLTADDDASLLERADGLRSTDWYTYGTGDMTARANSPRRRAAALLVTTSLDMSPPSAGASLEPAFAVLDGGGVKRRLRLANGQADFVALAAADYRVEVDLGGGQRVLGRVRIHDRQLATLSLP